MGKDSRPEKEEELPAATAGDRERFYETLRRIDAMAARQAGAIGAALGSPGCAARRSVLSSYYSSRERQDAWERMQENAWLDARSIPPPPSIASATPPSDLPDYTSLSQTMNQSSVGTYNVITSGPDGVLGIATHSPQQAEAFIKAITVLQKAGTMSAEIALRQSEERAKALAARNSPRKIAAAPKPKEITQRIGDEQRNACNKVLEDAFAGGYLKQDEYDRRMERAMSATSQAVLDGLLADLKNVLASPMTGKISPASDTVTLRRSEYRDLANESRRLSKEVDSLRGISGIAAFTAIMFAILFALAVAGVI